MSDITEPATEYLLQVAKVGNVGNRSYDRLRLADLRGLMQFTHGMHDDSIVIVREADCGRSYRDDFNHVSCIVVESSIPKGK